MPARNSGTATVDFETDRRRVRNGKPKVTDGPFAETKEQLGGYYLVDAKDTDEAIAIAKQHTAGRYGSIEVRPIMTFSWLPVVDS